MFYDQTKNTGWFVSVFKARRVQAKNKKKADANGDNEAEDEFAEYGEEEAKEDLEFLRTLVIDNKTDMEMVEQKLKATMEYRKQICNDPNVNLLERVPFFFTHSDLVIIYHSD